MAGLNELVRLTDLKKEQIVDIFDAILNLIRTGQRVSIRGFGSFWEHERKAGKVTSSAIPGGEAPVPAAKVLRFKAAKSTKRVIKGQGKAREQ